MRILKMIATRGHRARDFERAAKKKGVLMIAPADTVNFVKDFLVNKKLDNNPIGKHIVNARVKGEDEEGGPERIGFDGDSDKTVRPSRLQLPWALGPDGCAQAALNPRIRRIGRI